MRSCNQVIKSTSFTMPLVCCCCDRGSSGSPSSLSSPPLLVVASNHTYHISTICMGITKSSKNNSSFGIQNLHQFRMLVLLIASPNAWTCIYVSSRTNYFLLRLQRVTQWIMFQMLVDASSHSLLKISGNCINSVTAIKKEADKP